ncbi:YjcQ family protein (plasmid) [Ligilactobacillus salivarius]|uniref:YjcQ family protein n=1 Tax=Ligilactobacillus salivarius TaxID=1624 RepID=A0ABD7YYA1_9LACO|nr:YjcQ family protein [Ligilactobacillus salivarius]WHS04923.1 YjcQ family protein [Ligilactobacillus salivarius]WHS09011.1 YjcQ family protein [Ligilactobacillus salivarius]WHS11231.1 YjcQ family protein [Ligilactobacillus salivarius]WHS15150.1 YjcQ family protein [Ligilactobacillus salivarius]WHS18774.1 YjcQ family protein [Ligilactobacillus salivarius]
MLTDDGYIKGIEFLDVIPPEMSKLTILEVGISQAIQYLEEKSLIRKAYNTLKDWLPLM